jgi:hypothetical protein
VFLTLYDVLFSQMNDPNHDELHFARTKKYLLETSSLINHFSVSVPSLPAFAAISSDDYWQPIDHHL